MSIHNFYTTNTIHAGSGNTASYVLRESPAPTGYFTGLQSTVPGGPSTHSLDIYVVHADTSETLMYSGVAPVTPTDSSIPDNINWSCPGWEMLQTDALRLQFKNNHGWDLSGPTGGGGYMNPNFYTALCNISQQQSVQEFVCFINFNL